MWLIFLLTIVVGVLAAGDSTSTSVSQTSRSSNRSTGSASASSGASSSASSSSENTNSRTNASSRSNSSPSATTTRSMPSLRSTSSRSMPSLRTTSTNPSLTSRSSHTDSASSSSSFVPTFTPIVPNEEDNRYIYRASHAGGTVFIAVGSCLGFILLLVGLVVGIFTITSWYRARKEYKLKEIESKYQSDPFFFSQATDSGDNNSYSDNDDNSDISEKVLKTRNSRMTLHTLGSTSVFNLLNHDNKSSDVLDNSAQKQSHNKRQSMFISPTEILQNEGGNQSNIWSDSNFSSSRILDSADSTPREQVRTQFINNPSMSNLASNTPWKESISPREYIQNNSSLLRPDLTSSHGYSVDSGVQQRDASPKLKKNYRPPSVHLDTLLDGNYEQ